MFQIFRRDISNTIKLQNDKNYRNYYVHWGWKYTYVHYKEELGDQYQVVCICVRETLIILQIALACSLHHSWAYILYTESQRKFPI
jgi:hypothetical protein